MHMHEQENIFNTKKRTYNDCLQKIYVAGTDPEEDIQARLSKQAQINNKNFQIFMQKNYAYFNHKIHKCKLSCLTTSNSYTEVHKCYRNCEVGMKTFKRFVDQRINQMQHLLNQCISNASELPNVLHESYRCYQLYNKGFPYLQSIIKEESLYYQ